MNIRIDSDFNFSVSSIQYAPNGVLCITLSSGENQGGSRKRSPLLACCTLHSTSLFYR